MYGQKRMNRMSEYLVAVAIVVAGAFGLAWYLKVQGIPPGITVEAKPASEVKHETKVEIPVRKVKVYKPAAKAKLKLPDAAIWDKGQHVIASSKIANDDRPHTITTTINATTGETMTYDRIDPLPWLAVNTKSEIGLYAGIKRGETAMKLEGKQEIMQIKAIHLGAIASVDAMRSGTDSFVGVGVWGRW